MKMNKEKFLKTEFGSELEGNIRALNYYLNEIKKVSPVYNEKEYKTLDNDIHTLFSKWHVFQLALKQFYGIEYNFTRTEDYYGLCTDKKDFLFQHKHEN